MHSKPRALVIGMGATGLSLARHLDSRGFAVSAADDRPHPPMAAEYAAALPGAELRRGNFREWSAADFQPFQIVAVSSGVSVSGSAIPPEKITGDAALFGAEWRRVAPPSGLIAVTGTNGKSTVSALCAHLCRVADAPPRRSATSASRCWTRWRTGPARENSRTSRWRSFPVFNWSSPRRFRATPPRS